MDVGLMMRSAAAADDQMEIMSMMMQLDRLPEFGGSSSNSYYHQEPLYELPEMEFSGGSSCSIDSSAPPPYFQPPNFHITPHQQPRTSPRDQKTACATSMEAMREMIFGIAALQPVQIDPESVKPPKRRNVKISKDPQSVAARHRRERISERIRILQRMVPGGTKMDTASMLDEAVQYVKFLKKQVESLESRAPPPPAMGVVGYPAAGTVGTAAGSTMMNYYSSPLEKGCQAASAIAAAQMVGSNNNQMLR